MIRLDSQIERRLEHVSDHAHTTLDQITKDHVNLAIGKKKPDQLMGLFCTLSSVQARLMSSLNEVNELDRTHAMRSGDCSHLKDEYANQHSENVSFLLEHLGRDNLSSLETQVLSLRTEVRTLLVEVNALLRKEQRSDQG